MTLTSCFNTCSYIERLNMQYGIPDMIVFSEGLNGLPRVWLKHCDRCVLPFQTLAALKSWYLLIASIRQHVNIICHLASATHEQCTVHVAVVCTSSPGMHARLMLSILLHLCYDISMSSISTEKVMIVFDRRSTNCVHSLAQLFNWELA